MSTLPLKADMDFAVFSPLAALLISTSPSATRVTDCSESSRADHDKRTKLPNDHNRRYAAANLGVGRSNSQTTITALTTFQIRPLRNAAR